jgi:hypothetical protein
MTKLEYVTTVETVTALNANLLARTQHAGDGKEPHCCFIGAFEFGAARVDAKQLYVGRKVKVTVELLPDDNSL